MWDKLIEKAPSLTVIVFGLMGLAWCMDTVRMGVVYSKFVIGPLPENRWYVIIWFVASVMIVLSGAVLFFEDRLARRLSPHGLLGRALAYWRSIISRTP